MTDVFNLLASATKPEQVKNQGPTEEQVKEIGDAFHGIIEKLKGEIEFERKYNPDDCDITSWGNQGGILISVAGAELLVKMYDEMNVQHP